MRYLFICALTLASASLASAASAQTNPLWHEVKTKNYLPHMTWPEVRDLLTRSDVALIPVPALEQHGPQTRVRCRALAWLDRLRARRHQQGRCEERSAKYRDRAERHDPIRSGLHDAPPTTVSAGLAGATRSASAR